MTIRTLRTRPRSPTSRYALLAAFLLGAAGSGGFPAQAAFLAGAGRAGISIPASTLPLDGFTIVHDPLEVRVVLLDDHRQRAAIAVIDQTSIFDDLVNAVQAAIGKAASVDPADIIVIASHTFSAPHAFAGDHLPPGMTLSPDDRKHGAAYRTAILDAATAAAVRAKNAMAPAHARFSAGSSGVNVNRNRLSAQGWWLGADEDGYADRNVGVLSLDGDDRRPIAMLINYAVQSSVMDHSIGGDGGKAVTADLAGATVRRVEALRPGSVALFLTGAAGDQMPAYTARRNVYDAVGNFRTVDIGDQGFPLVELQGERLADAALRARPVRAGGTADNVRVVHGFSMLDSQERPRNLQQIKPSHSYHYATGGRVRAPFVILTVGDTAIVGVQAELSARTGAAIRAHSPFAHTMVVTMVNGAAKYMPDAAAYRAITYEAMNSSFAPGSAERFAHAIERELAMIGGARRRPAHADGDATHD